MAVILSVAAGAGIASHRAVACARLLRLAQSIDWLIKGMVSKTTYGCVAHRPPVGGAS